MKRGLAIGYLAAAICSSVHGWAAETPAAQQGAQAQIPDTLMFSIDELNEIRSRAGTGRAGGTGANGGNPIEDATLYLSTIMYYGPNDWTVWINGIAIKPQQDFAEFEVTAIGPDFVELLVPLSAQGVRPVKLAPNQTFIAKSGTVVEGRWR